MKHTFTLLTALLLAPLATLHAADNAAAPKPITSSGERWVHPALKPQPLQLPETFDQQTMVVLGDGRLMTVPPQGNATIVSRDEGKTWSEPRPMRTSRKPVLPTRGPLIRTRSGVLILLFQTGNSWLWNNAKRGWILPERSNLWVTRSLDDGETWDEPRQPFAGSYGTITGSIQTRGGNVVVPIEIRLHDPPRWGTYVFVSPDDGETWSRSNLIDLGGHGHHDGAIEAAITELSDNRLMLLIRTNLDRFWEAYSEDHGYHWRELQPSQVDASSAPGYLQRLASGRLVLVWNRVNREGAAPTLRSAPSAYAADGSSSQREELSLSYSDDDGQNWAPGVVIARQTNGSICYPFVLEPTPGELWIWTRYGSQPPLCVSLKEQDLSAMQGPTPKK